LFATQIPNRGFEQLDGIAKSAQPGVASRTQQAAHGAGRVVMIDSKPADAVISRIRLLTPADGTEISVRRREFRIIVEGHPEVTQAALQLPPFLARVPRTALTAVFFAILRDALFRRGFRRFSFGDRFYLLRVRFIPRAKVRLAALLAPRLSTAGIKLARLFALGTNPPIICHA
jgi:hypothetical protein